MKRKKIDNRNENRKLKRRAAAILKKELAIGRAEYAKVMRIRERKTNSRLKKFRESIKERYEEYVLHYPCYYYKILT